jgi:hypothetical protein
VTPPSPAPSAAASPPAEIRTVVLACRDARLAVAGGGVLRLDPATPCPADAAGRTFALTFASDGAVVVRLRPARTGEVLETPDRIPPIAWAVAPRVPLASGEKISVVVDVYVPARTPATDDIYLATERSNWNPTEIRMNRVDGRHFSATIVVARGTALALQISRGSYASLERDAARTVPPPHTIDAEPGVKLRIDVAAWADID